MKLQEITPFEPISTDHCPAGEDWIAQVKWDGVRMLTYFDGEEVKLINRKGNERTLQYPEFTCVRNYCKSKSVILDGEIIGLAGGRPSFHEVMKRDSLRRPEQIQYALGQVSVNYMIFDILYCDGEWVTDQSLSERQALLQQIIIPNEHLQLVPNYTDSERLFEVMKNQGWEGIVFKNLLSTYKIGGKDNRWQKRKIFRDLYAAIGGVTYRDEIVNSVLLGLYDENRRFVYIGHAGTGKLTKEDWCKLTDRIFPHIINKRPFYHAPQRQKGAVWIQPTLTVKVRFLEWTPGGTMRHPSIQAMTEHVHVNQCLLTQST